MKEDNYFENELEKLNLERVKIDERILKLRSEQVAARKAAEERQKHANAVDEIRKEFLFANSVPLNEATVEVHNGYYFIVATDDSFSYVIRLNPDQAEHLADELDHEIKKEVDRIQGEFSIVNNLFKDMFDGQA